MRSKYACYENCCYSVVGVTLENENDVVLLSTTALLQVDMEVNVHVHVHNIVHTLHVNVDVHVCLVYMHTSMYMHLVR